MLRKAALLTLLVGLIGLGVPTLAVAPASAAQSCSEQASAFGETIQVCYEVAGSAPAVPASSTSSGSDSAEAPAPCSFQGVEFPCVSEHGAWDGRCYVSPAVPQPPQNSPIWLGNTDGIILDCTPGNCVITSTLGNCAGNTLYWSPVVPPGVPIDEATAARRAIAQLQLAPITITTAPTPNLAEPNILIGATTYFWAEGGTPAVGPLTITVTQDGLSITLAATLREVVFDTGDDVDPTVCTPADIAERPTDMEIDDPDPPCGHAWEHTGTYTLTATSTWDIAWQGPAQAGALDHTLTAEIQVAVRDRPVNLTTNK